MAAGGLHFFLRRFRPPPTDMVKETRVAWRMGDSEVCCDVRECATCITGLGAAGPGRVHVGACPAEQGAACMRVMLLPANVLCWLALVLFILFAVCFMCHCRGLSVFPF